MLSHSLLSEATRALWISKASESCCRRGERLEESRCCGESSLDDDGLVPAAQPCCTALSLLYCCSRDSRPLCALRDGDTAIQFQPPSPLLVPLDLVAPSPSHTRTLSAHVRPVVPPAELLAAHDLPGVERPRRGELGRRRERARRRVREGEDRRRRGDCGRAKGSESVQGSTASEGERRERDALRERLEPPFMLGAGGARAGAAAGGAGACPSPADAELAVRE